MSQHGKISEFELTRQVCEDRETPVRASVKVVVITECSGE